MYPPRRTDLSPSTYCVRIRRYKRRGRGSMHRLSAVLGAALLVAVSCGQAPTSTGTSPTPAASASAEQPQAGGRIVFGATGDPKTMQPVIATDTQSRDIWDKVYLS